MAMEYPMDGYTGVTWRQPNTAALRGARALQPFSAHRVHCLLHVVDDGRHVLLLRLETPNPTAPGGVSSRHIVTYVDAPAFLRLDRTWPRVEPF